MISWSQKQVASMALFLLVLLLWYLRWEQLHNPYFWDEMGVYAYGVQYLFEYGISILPKDLPPDISRGHPLLFYSFHASFLKIFGNHLFVSHAVALVISSLTLIATYKLARVFVSPIVAILAPILLACQNIFLAQSSLVLPEMLIALLTVLACTSYFQKKYFWCISYLVVGVWVKESHILTAGFIGLVYLVETIRSDKLKTNLPTLISFGIPLLALFLFLGIQKIQNGWYFFPYHTELVSDGVLAGFRDKFKEHLKFLFYSQGRFLWLPIILMGILSAVFSKHKKAVLLIAFFVGYTVLLFSLAFYLNRYLLYLYPILCVMIVIGISSFFKRSFFAIGAIVILCFYAIQSWNDPTFNYDASMSYSNVIEIHKEAINDLCTNENAIKVYSTFPINMSLWGAYLGYANQECLNKIELLQEAKNSHYVLLFDETLSEQGYTLTKVYQNPTGKINFYSKSSLAE